MLLCVIFHVCVIQYNRVNRAPLQCVVSYCGSTSVQDDLVTLDVFFFHSASSVEIKVLYWEYFV